MSNDSDKPDQVTSLTLLIRALRADLGPRGGNRYNAAMEPPDRKKALRCAGCGGKLEIGYG
jgi:hypothetical protein